MFTSDIVISLLLTFLACTIQLSFFNWRKKNQTVLVKKCRLCVSNGPWHSSVA